MNVFGHVTAESLGRLPDNGTYLTYEQCSAVRQHWQECVEHYNSLADAWYWVARQVTRPTPGDWLAWAVRTAEELGHSLAWWEWGSLAPMM